MAVVPYGPRKVQTAALPGVRRTAALTNEAAGVGVAEAEARSALQQGDAAASKANAVAGLANTVHGATRQVADIVIAEQKKADEIQALANENKLAAWVNKRVYDPETGALTVKGKDSMTLPEDVLRDFNDFAGTLESELPNDRQKADFLKQRARVELNLDGTIRRHVFEQMQRYDAAETQSAIENGIQEAITNSSDPRMVGESIQKSLAAAAGFAKRNGIGPEQRQQQADAIQEKGYVGVIDNLLAADNTKAATVYFEEAKSAGILKGDAVTRIEKALKAGKDKKEAQEQADKILGEGGTLSQQREKARKIEDPDVRDSVMARLEHEDAVADAARREKEQTQLRDAYALVDSTKSVEGLSAQQRVDLAEHMPALRAYALSRAKGVPVETDQPTFYSLIRRAMDEPDGFATENLLKFRAKLSDADFQQLAGIQLNIKNGERSKVEKDLGGFRTNGQIVDDALTSYGIDPNAKPETKEGKAIANLRQMLDTRVQTQADLTGKKPSNTDIQGMIDGILSQSTKVPGSWWNIFPGGKPFFDQEKRLIDTTAQDIPADERRQIEDALRQRGRPVSDATVLNLYLETQARKVK